MGGFLDGETTQLFLWEEFNRRVGITREKTTLISTWSKSKRTGRQCNGIITHVIPPQTRTQGIAFAPELWSRLMAIYLLQYWSLPRQWWLP